jgi:hypothetical protein
LDYEIAKLIDQAGIEKVLGALTREAEDRGMVRLFRRLHTVWRWLGTPAGSRDLAGFTTSDGGLTC